tara:strand:- start:16182 stop:17543 length:1362 start_codon:yes stop_codon:yes gene_type:complete
MRSPQKKTDRLGLRSRVTCPHCWQEFAAHETNWISVHPDLSGDPIAGSDEQLRFLPTRFNVNGQAIDMNGVACSELACPHCHLKIPRALLEMKPLFFSILGAPGSGKSYFLASMIWGLRNILRRSFRLAFSDADPLANQLLNQYEEKLFLNPDSNELVALPKTEKEGELYQGVSIDQRTVWLAKPFVFSLQPDTDHQLETKSSQLSRAVCLYDNAGEHFLPGGSNANNYGTQHLSLSQALFFLFDPTQHPQVRSRCSGKSADPQMMDHAWTHRQDQVLFEAASRIRTQAGIPQNAKYKRPLIVVVTKYDAWCSLIGCPPLNSAHLMHESDEGRFLLDTERILKVSDKIRKVLSELTPEFITAAESFAEDVTYIPVSALGTSPEIAPHGGFLAIRPSRIRPMWTEIPFLYGLHKAVPHLIPSASSTARRVAPAVDQITETQASAIPQNNREAGS